MKRSLAVRRRTQIPAEERHHLILKPNGEGANRLSMVCPFPSYVPENWIFVFPKLSDKNLVLNSSRMLTMH